MRILKGDEYPDKSAEWLDGFTTGVQSVLAIRCIDHRAQPLMNDDAAGAECPICAWEAFREQVKANLGHNEYVAKGCEQLGNSEELGK